MHTINLILQDKTNYQMHNFYVIICIMFHYNLFIALNVWEMFSNKLLFCSFLQELDLSVDLSAASAASEE